jgi:hypothetical protein
MYIEIRIVIYNKGLRHTIFKETKYALNLLIRRALLFEVEVELFFLQFILLV